MSMKNELKGLAAAVVMGLIVGGFFWGIFALVAPLVMK